MPGQDLFKFDSEDNYKFSEILKKRDLTEIFATRAWKVKQLTLRILRY